jgi:hypothetical protein
VPDHHRQAEDEVPLHGHDAPRDGYGRRSRAVDVPEATESVATTARPLLALAESGTSAEKLPGATATSSADRELVGE